MLKNYLIVAVRNLRRRKGYAFINIGGLAVGMAACLFIARYVQGELAYDRFHEKADRLYRVALDRQRPSNRDLYARTPPPLAAALKAEIPEVEQATRLWGGQSVGTSDPVVRYADRVFSEPRFLLADANVFEVFTFPLLQGDPATALEQPGAVVITQSTAQRYFGEETALGKTLTTDTYGDLTVTGITADLPQQAHFHFDMLASLATLDDGHSDSWAWFRAYTYVVLPSGYTPDALEAKLPALVDNYLGPQIEDRGTAYDTWLATGNAYRFFLQPVTDIHLHSHLLWEVEPNGNATYVYLFAGVAVVILLLACINFVNLATARSERRAREVGVRKALGSQRTQLVQQFLTESVLSSLLALGLALTLTLAMRPLVAAGLGAGAVMRSLGGVTLVGLIAFAGFIGLLAGSYPALYLSAFRPACALKGLFAGATQGGRLRNGLVVFQFAMSVILLAGTGVVYQQLTFMRGHELGFEKEHKVVIARADALGAQRETFKQALLNHPGVRQAGASSTVPGRWIGTVTMRGTETDYATSKSIKPIFVDYDFVATYGLNLKAGRDFSRAYASDSLAIILNEAAVRHFNVQEPVGQVLRGWGDLLHPVVGVVDNFHYESLHQEIEPLVLFVGDVIFPDYQFITVRIGPDDVPGTLAAMKATWDSFAPDHPFQYSFLDADFEALYKADQVRGRLFGVFAVLAVFIGCLGLFGLVAFTAEQRTQEIGIRKVLGATVVGIFGLLTKDFLRLVALACVVAAPLAYLATNRWLDTFAYRIDLRPGVFLLAGGLALGIALLTVSYQAVKAALADPVRSLRYE